MLAMWGGFEVPQRVVDGFYVGSLGETEHAIVLPRYYDGEFRRDWSRVIPLAPIWTGFAVDTLFYTAVWIVLLLLLVGPGIIRRTVRHIRSLCPACAYPIGESAVCSECGRALPGRARATT